MINARRATALLWTANVLLILGIAALIPRGRPPRELTPPRSVPLDPQAEDRTDVGALAGARLTSPEPEVVLLLGFDRIARDPSADTAYLFLVSRKTRVNAYVGEAILDPVTGREIPELSGWRLARVTSQGAVFSTPKGERVLRVAEIPSTMASAVEAFRHERVEEACARFEAAFEMRPSSEVVYALLVEMGEDLVASMMNSKDPKVRAIAYRLFELAKPGGERKRPSVANA